MRTALSIGLLPFWCLRGVSRARRANRRCRALAGILQHDGIREPVSVELGGGEQRLGRPFSTSHNSMTLESVRVSGSNVHFELPGEGVFDGAAAGDSMAGSVSAR